MNEIAIRPATVQLSVGSLLTVMYEGAPHIVLRPAVEALGLSYGTQRRKLKGRSWACVAQQAMQLPGDTQMRTVDIVPTRTLLMLLATINENRVTAGARDTLIAFQSETADAIEAYWTGGQAIRPQAAAPAPQIPTTLPDALRLAADEYERAEGLEVKLVASRAQVRELEPLAAVAETIGRSEGISLTRFHNSYFVGYPYRDFFAHLYRRGYCRDERGKRWSESQQKWVAGFQHQHPKAKGRPFLYVTGDFVDEKGRRHQQVRVRPGRYELDFVRALVRDGLPMNPAKTMPGLPELNTRVRRAVAASPAVLGDPELEDLFEREDGAW